MREERAGPRVLEVAVVPVAEAPQGRPAREAEHWLSTLPGTHDLDVANSPPDPDPGLGVMTGLCEVDLAVRWYDAQAVEVDQLVTLDRGPAARVLPAAYSHHDIHLLMVLSGSAVRKRRCTRWAACRAGGRPIGAPTDWRVRTAVRWDGTSTAHEPSG